MFSLLLRLLIAKLLLLLDPNQQLIWLELNTYRHSARKLMRNGMRRTLPRARRS
jgi:hypothetical protein